MCFFFQAEDGIRDLVRSRGLGDVYKRQEQRLPLAHHAEAGVVDDGDLDRDVVDDAGRKLLVGHLEAAVAVDGPHLSLIHI